jgi:hypothetical protein
VNKADDRGVIPLCIASEKGHKEIVGQLIEAGAAVDESRTDDGITPLHIASYTGHMEVAKLLALSGANIDFLDQTDWERGWPLHDNITDEIKAELKSLNGKYGDFLEKEKLALKEDRSTYGNHVMSQVCKKFNQLIKVEKMSGETLEEAAVEVVAAEGEAVSTESSKRLKAKLVDLPGQLLLTIFEKASKTRQDSLIETIEEKAKAAVGVGSEKISAEVRDRLRAKGKLTNEGWRDHIRSTENLKLELGPEPEMPR